MTRKIFSAILTLTIICSLNFCAAARKSVAVMPLENISGYTEQQVAEIMTEQLIVAIHTSGAYTVVERTQLGTVIKEQGFQNIAVDPATAVKLGKLIGADYSILGKVTMALVENNITADVVSRLGGAFGLGDIASTAGQYVHKFKGRIEFEFRLVDNETGEIILAKTVAGNKSGSNVPNAINNACKQAAENFSKEINELNPFRARVAEVYGSDIYIDQGSEAGLRRGETLIVAREGAPIVVNGKIVGVRQTEVGKVKVVEVNVDYAICRADEKSGNIQKGDVVKRS